ncbi:MULTISPECIES: tol-pal system protein YbgF [unclassified Pseudovibrio]|uniref:tol-pal system protein YbgF n=1 Tax=unclassified Pseudovibrio TaxID=2627060 RepID=UPI0007AEBBFF|nr:MULTISPECIES: tol-pal system protein YbgF [unclassified Pseudovibrio]KZL04014.1 tol-pal system protein YbgF [Pseudovibrio sp. W74]KZL04233.1 tol-pal system protein YbgF [Pseudovibrio sp. Ad14]
MALYRRIATSFVVLALVTSTSLPASAQLFGSSKNDETAQNTARLGQLEEQVRLLTGKVEELNHKLRLTEDALRRSQEDVEYRLQQLENPGQTPRVVQPPVVQQPSTTAPTNRSQQLSTLNTPAQGTNSGPLDLSQIARGNNAAPTGSTPAPSSGSLQFSGSVNELLSGDPQSDYNAVYGLMVGGNYPAATEGFDTFLGMYPDHELTANAQHWLGESLLAQRQYENAAQAFLKSYTDFPESELAPESLLKLGTALTGMGNAPAACETYEQLLANFQFAAPAVLEQAKVQQKRDNCL